MLGYKSMSMLDERQQQQLEQKHAGKVIGLKILPISFI